MKSIKKLMSFHNHKAKEKGDSFYREPLDSKRVLEEESKEMQGLKEMRIQYEGLCAVSSLVSTRATDFSSAIHELANYFINTFGSIEDGEMSKIFKIVGRVQFEISKILDIYAVHVAQTITEPTEILLSELQNVQDSKTQHDEKRQLYEQLRARTLKGRSKSGKGEAFADQQMQIVKDEFDKLSLFVNARFNSLEQGQARSLITQAARHHSAQMHLFSRGHSSLQAVEPYMRQVARERSIDRQLSTGINEEDDESDSKSEDDVSYIDELDGSSDPQSLEQSNRWDSRIDSPGRSPDNQDEEPEVPKNLSKEWSSLLSRLNRNSGEIPHLRSGDSPGSAAPQPSKDLGNTTDAAHSYRTRTVPDSHQEQNTIHVTELIEEPKSSQGRTPPLSPPLRPHPEVSTNTARGHDGVGSELSSQSVSTSGRTLIDQRSSLDAEGAMSGTLGDSSGMKSKFSQNSASSPETSQVRFSVSGQNLPGPVPGKPPSLSFVSPTLSSTPVGFTSNTQEFARQGRRYSQSGPLTFSGSPWSSQPSSGNVATSTMQSSNPSDCHKSGPLGRSPLGRTFGSPRISPSMSPPRMSPPRISELHKLPPPPLNPINTKAPRSPPIVAHSAPIIAHSAPLSRHPDPMGNSFVNATPLPPPPLGSVPRSLSLPSRQKIQRSRPPTIAQLPEVNEEDSQPSSPATNNFTSSVRGNGSSFTSQGQNVNKRVPSGNMPGQENGLPPSDLKFVHFNAAKSASGTPTWSSQHMRQPLSSPGGGNDKAQQVDGRRVDSGSPRSIYAPTLKSGGSLNPSRWRSLSINDKDNYVQSIARAVAIQRELQPEMVSLNPT
ncbi:unnamed protein product [Calypogeia fissa]